MRKLGDFGNVPSAEWKDHSEAEWAAGGIGAQDIAKDVVDYETFDVIFCEDRHVWVAEESLMKIRKFSHF